MRKLLAQTGKNRGAKFISMFNILMCENKTNFIFIKIKVVRFLLINTNYVT